MFWATDSALTLGCLVIWCMFYLFSLATRQIDWNDQRISVLTGLCGLLYVGGFITIFIVFIQHGELHKSFGGMHRNLIAQAMTPLFLIILCTMPKTKWRTLLHILSALILVLVLFLTDARGVIISVILSITAYFLIKKIRLDKKMIFAGAGTVILIATVIFLTPIRTQIADSKIVTEWSERNELDRYYMIKHSFALIPQSDYLGVGFGNWAIHGGYVDFEIYPSSDDWYFDLVIRNHNLPSKILGELGPVGFMLWILAFLPPVFLFIKDGKQNSKLEIAAFLILIACASNTNFYRTAFSQWFIFSLNQFWLFFAWGILSGKLKSENMKSLRPVVKILITLITVAVMSFYMIDSYIDRNIDRILHEERNNKRAGEMLNEFYDPRFKTYHKQTSIPILLTSLFQSVNKKKLIEKNYKRALQIDPKNPKILKSYATFLVRNRELRKADEILERLLENRSIHYDIYILQAEMAFYNNDNEAAFKYLSWLPEAERRKAILQKVKSNRTLSPKEELELDALKDVITNAKLLKMTADWFNKQRGK